MTLFFFKNAGGTRFLSLLLLAAAATTKVVHGQLINEFKPNPPSFDPPIMTVEFKGTPGSTFTGCFISIECDNIGQFGYVDRATPITIAFDSNGIATHDVNDIENPSFVAALLNTASCPSTGQPAPATLSGVDALGVVDSAADQANCHPSGFGLPGELFSFTGDSGGPKLVFRDSVTNEWFAVNDPDNGGAVRDNFGNKIPGSLFSPVNPTAVPDTFGSINPTLPPRSTSTIINEFKPNPNGRDPSRMTVELKGPPGSAFFGCFISIECDNTSKNIDRASVVSGIHDANGLLLVDVPDLENPSFVAALLDTIDCPTINSEASSQSLSAIDAIGVPDAVADEAKCHPIVNMGLSVGQMFSYTGDEPRLVFRDGICDVWYAVNDPDGGIVYDINARTTDGSIFDIDPTVGMGTFGSINPTTIRPGVDGDPHFLSWNGTWYDYMGECDLILLDAPNFYNNDTSLLVAIRTTGRYQYSYVESVAIQIGKEDVVEIDSYGSYYFNGVEGTRLPKLLANKFPVSKTQINKKRHRFSIALDNHENEMIVVETFKDLVSVNFERVHDSRFIGSRGMMGDYETGKLTNRKGTVEITDPELLASEWQVRPEIDGMPFESIRSPQFPQPCRRHSAAGNNKATRKKQIIAQEDAQKSCGHLRGFKKDACVHDVIAIGDLELAATF